MQIPDLAIVGVPATLTNLDWLSVGALARIEASDLVVASLPVRNAGGAPAWGLVWSEEPVRDIERGLAAGEAVTYLAFEPMVSDPVVQELAVRGDWGPWIQRIPGPWALTLIADYQGQAAPDASAVLEEFEAWLSGWHLARRADFDGAGGIGRSVPSGLPSAPVSGSAGWWAERPLSGIHLLALRDGEGAHAAGRTLSRWGAEVMVDPILSVERVELDPGTEWQSYDWIVFTSAEAVRQAIDQCCELGIDIRRLRGSIAVIGQTTARTLRGYGLRPALVPAPEAMNQEGLAAAFSACAMAGQRVLWFSGDRNRLWLKEQLQGQGAVVDMIPVYRNQKQPLSASTRAQIAEGRCHGIMYSSSSTVLELAAQSDRDTIERVRSLRAFSIGPETSRALRQHGMRIAAEALHASWDNLAHTVAEYFYSTGISDPETIGR